MWTTKSLSFYGHGANEVRKADSSGLLSGYVHLQNVCRLISVEPALRLLIVTLWKTTLCGRWGITALWRVWRRWRLRSTLEDPSGNMFNMVWSVWVEMPFAPTYRTRCGCSNLYMARSHQQAQSFTTHFYNLRTAQPVCTEVPVVTE